MVSDIKTKPLTSTRLEFLKREMKRTGPPAGNPGHVVVTERVEAGQKPGVTS